MIAVLGAMDAEVSELLSHLESPRIDEWWEYRFHVGTACDRPVVMGKCGVGKTLSAMVTQHLIERYDPRAIVFTGVAGTLDPEIHIGDTVVAEDCLQYDVDAGQFGFEIGEIPYSGYRLLSCDPDLVARAFDVQPEEGEVYRGRVLTGDGFVSGRNPDLVRMLRDELHGTVVEMEGASVGLVATVQRIPFVLIRTVSDRADGRAPKQFQEFLRYASRNAWHFVSRLLEGL